MNVVTFGTFDIPHVGHIKILNRAKALGDRLIVGVSSDELNFAKKGRSPIYTQEERMFMINSIKGVNEVFLEESLELKREYLIKHQADILVMGDDWKGKFDEFSDICQVVYLPRTPSISTTSVIEIVKTNHAMQEELTSGINSTGD
ncbi:adenylyltransferase/cytidyltransferase family protein [Aliikangiella coralliicola]|uniref:Adenylyltransferase/cytidyltransferase family protein n=1 Tax=Aliikangiella coralliicola TaxID=2592383 RepID=A0A545TW31_9GAMM|nr:adenylyltransferase/cytidyltransferase family protein [Aliikangiella coralliicola]TQV81429.1 adenylyltransferase/cytidyltransferase family protein [Aliikangiella coralliicola]